MIITLTLKNKESREYDLTIKKDLTEFKKMITKAINQKDSIQLNKAKNQLEHIVADCSEAKTQLERINEALTQIEGPQMTKQAKNIEAAVEEDGEKSFQLLYAALLGDMAKYSGDLNLLVCYATLVVNLFVHMATYTPHDNHGKAQQREFDHKSQLEYFRSQGNHANALLFNKLMKSSQTSQKKSRLPFNGGFLKLIGPDNFDEKFCAELRKIDPATGYIKAGEDNVESFVILKIAHAGARKNNFSTLMQGIMHGLDALPVEEFREKLKKKLIDVLPPTQKIMQLEPADCGRKIRALLGRFQYFSGQNETPDLSSRLLKYRMERIEALKKHDKLIHLQHIQLQNSPQDMTCLMIRLYPLCKETNATYTEGVTNVLLSFFGALLNHFARKKKLQLYTERRQSFGFLRPTLTDAGCLIIRLSLGLEPQAFDKIVIKSLKSLDALLEKFKFNQADHKSVKNVFKRMPKKNEASSRATDTYIQNIVRKDDRTLNTFRQAHAYIEQAASEDTSNDESIYLAKAMKDFLAGYVCKSNELKLPQKPTTSKKVDVVQPRSSQTIALLENILAYTVRFTGQLEFLENEEPLAQFAHVYYHSLLKLFNHCSQAHSLLKNNSKMEATEFYRQATLQTENILEYLISLDGLRLVRATLNPKDNFLEPVEQLRNTELSYVAHSLNVPKKALNLYFTDSGQQAITTALITLSIMLHGKTRDGKSYDGDIYIFEESYFEVTDFIEDCKKSGTSLQMRDIKKAKIIFIDITQLSNFSLKKCPAMLALVIDITHHPLYVEHTLLKQIIADIRKKGIWVTLVESALKHEQLGLDKYQTGRILVMAPPGKKIPAEADDLFKKVSDEAIHPFIASYLQMVNEICNDKVLTPPCLAAPLLHQANLVEEPVVQQREQIAKQVLVKQSFFKAPALPTAEKVHKKPSLVPC